MSYGPKDLKSQLIEYAAKRVLGKVVDAVAKHASDKITDQVNAYRFAKALNPQPSKSTKRNYSMATFTEADRFKGTNTRAQAAANAAENAANAGGKRQPQEPVELWVNTVIVLEDNTPPVRILTGRPLRAFHADRDVTTSNEEFNRVNRISNAFVEMMQEDAAKLNFGESAYYSPQGVKMVGGEPMLAAGIYLQLHREITDYAAEAANKLDLIATEKENLRKLFG